MTPSAYYQNVLREKLLQPDDEQHKALAHLDAIYEKLLNENKKRQGIVSRIRKKHTIKGLYLWGTVGIGKTFMMDCFYHALPFQNKRRMHFHAFMQRVHQDLKLLQGKKNPLTLIAKKIAKTTWVICFDEFFVSDIADAMILTQLFDALFSHGVTLIATSNTEPDKLYERGLQRQQFLPTIALIKKHTTILHLATTADYRLRHLKDAGVYYTPNDSLAAEKMARAFDVLTQEAAVDASPLTLHDRVISVIKKANDVIWFDFNVICNVPRSQDDYLQLAEKYHTVLVSNVPVIREHAVNTIILFIKMVDVFYDQGIRLILSADTPVSEIYTEGRYLKAFARTRSRLLEMQSEDYFKRRVD